MSLSIPRIYVSMAYMNSPKFCPGLCLTAALVSLTFLEGSTWAKTPSLSARTAKRVIGPTAIVKETQSNFAFPARVDTGATTSSLHVEDCKIEDEAAEMSENLGKMIRFRIKNQQGESEWLQRKIVQVSVVKTSEREERRYKVPVTLNVLNIKKRVLVSLNDRSHMAYPMLLGRNFLQGDFVVDVALGEESAGKSVKTVKHLAKQRFPKAGNNASRTKIE